MAARARLAVLLALVGTALSAAPAGAAWKFINNPAYDAATVQVCRDGVRMDWALGSLPPAPAVDPLVWPFRLVASTRTADAVWTDAVVAGRVADRVLPVPWAPIEAVDESGAPFTRAFSGTLVVRYPGGRLPVGRPLSIWANANTANTAASRVLVATIADCLVASPPAAPSASCLGQPATIVGTSGADVIVGTPRRDVIAGRGGGDRISGVGGNDLICGGPGVDAIAGGDGDDAIDVGRDGGSASGGPGADTIFGSSAAETSLAGGDGADAIFAGGGADALLGGTGDDRLFGEDGGDILQGDVGVDLLWGGLGADRARSGLLLVPIE